MSTLCLIPARGGSKRIPRKNLRSLGGKPLLSWTIECAQQAGLFSSIVVSSDDAEILAIAAQSGVRADSRPPSLAGDRVRFVEVVEEFLRRPAESGRHASVAVLLPTCPFRSPSDVIAAYALLQRRPGFVVSVSEYEFPPAFALELAPDGEGVTILHPESYAATTQSQSTPRRHHPNGAIYFASAASVLAARTFFGDPLHAYVMPPERSLDIDHPHQFSVAEALLAHPSLCKQSI